jgi:ferredoxin
MKVTVKIDPTACITAANCVGIAPKFFHIGDEVYVELLDRSGAVRGTTQTYDATPEEVALFQEAVDSCPTRAIELVEES